MTRLSLLLLTCAVSVLAGAVAMRSADLSVAAGLGAMACSALLPRLRLYLGRQVKDLPDALPTIGIHGALLAHQPLGGPGHLTTEPGLGARP